MSLKIPTLLNKKLFLINYFRLTNCSSFSEAATPLDTAELASSEFSNKTTEKRCEFDELITFPNISLQFSENRQSIVPLLLSQHHKLTVFSEGKGNTTIEGIQVVSWRYLLPGQHTCRKTP